MTREDFDPNAVYTVTRERVNNHVSRLSARSYWYQFAGREILVTMLDEDFPYFRGLMRAPLEFSDPLDRFVISVYFHMDLAEPLPADAIPD